MILEMFELRNILINNFEHRVQKLDAQSLQQLFPAQIGQIISQIKLMFTDYEQTTHSPCCIHKRDNLLW